MVIAARNRSSRSLSTRRQVASRRGHWRRWCRYRLLYIRRSRRCSRSRYDGCCDAGGCVVVMPLTRDGWSADSSSLVGWEQVVMRMACRRLPVHHSGLLYGHHLSCVLAWPHHGGGGEATRHRTAFSYSYLVYFTHTYSYGEVLRALLQHIVLLVGETLTMTNKKEKK